MSSPYVQYAQEGRSPKEVARLLGCSQKTARQNLRAVAAHLSEAGERRAGAVGLLLQSGATQPDIARRRWTDIVLGIRKAA